MNEKGRASSLRGQRLTLVVLAVIFLSPIVLSWILFSFTDVGRDEENHGHGVLIDPPRNIQDRELTDPAAGQGGIRLYGKWSLVYLASGKCGPDCDTGLYTMRQLRLAMGPDAHRVQRVLFVLNPAGPVLSDRQLNSYSGQTIAGVDEEVLQTFKLTDAESPVKLRRLYIVDPLGNLMMSYPTGTDPAGIIKDLKRLLKYSRIG